MSREKFTGVVLAGGQSLRMGENKVLLSSGKETFLSRALGKLEAHTDDIVISTGPTPRYVESGYPVVCDAYQNGGALAGIEASLAAASRDLIFILPPDLPFAPDALIPIMVSMAQGYDGVVPFYDGFHEPLFAVYRRSCLGMIRRRLDQGERKVRSFYGDVHLNLVGKELLMQYGSLDQMFLNINTREDYRKYWEIANEN